MRGDLLRWLVALAVIVALPGEARAQEATLSGTVTDSTGGVLPGVTILAVHEATGNSFEAVTDERGAFRIPVRIGAYRITAELAEFATVARTIELLVGQQAVVNFQMSPSSLQESVTVTGEAPLIDVSQSSLGGNVDSRQMQELPLNGRNWMDLTVLAPGNRNNAVGDSPTPGRGAQGEGDYLLNLDGQDLTNNTNFGNQPRFSRDAIAEFQFVASRFDATQGRSSGVQVNAVSKSGTNTPSGSFSGYFRSDQFNAADHVTNRVLPYSDQQVSTTFGGPIRRDRLHFFANYEFEREPRTITYQSSYSRFNFDQPSTRVQHNGGLRLDFQLSSQTRLMARGNTWSSITPNTSAGGAIIHPSAGARGRNHADQLYFTLTQVLSNRALNEIGAGFQGIDARNQSIVSWPGNPQAANGVEYGTPRINFRGYSIGSSNLNWPQTLGHTRISIRDDFTFSFTKGGRHALKVGGEHLSVLYFLQNCRNCFGVYDAQAGPAPTNLEALFPVWNDVSTWNLAALSPLLRSYQRGVGNFRGEVPRRVYAAWLQDDWTITPRLTLNLGLRYDLATNTGANWITVPNILAAGRPNDINNFGPRLGFAYSLTDRTVLRGGFGRYYGDVADDISSFTIAASNVFIAQVLNDGRPDFATNPYNGPPPTFAELEQAWASGIGPVRSTGGEIAVPDANGITMPNSYQGSIGVQRQLGPTLAVEADFAFIIGRNERFDHQNVNLSYNPVTGINYPFSQIARRPIPGWGQVQMINMNGLSTYRGLQTGFTKRFSQTWQASGTYSFAGMWDENPLPYSGLQMVTFEVAPDLGADRSLAPSDQRHRAVFNGIWDAGFGFQLSGLYFFGSGERYNNTYGGDLREAGGGGGRLRPNGTLLPRNSFVGKQIHRVDLRVQRRFRFSNRAGIDGMVELFNVFNHANYGSYTIVESNAAYGGPTQNSNVAYGPRALQLGFRATF